MAGLQADRDIVAGLAEAKHAEYELEKKGLSPAASSHEQELDGIHDGLEFPTEEEKHTRRRVPDQVPWSAYCEHPFRNSRPMSPAHTLSNSTVIAVCELAERFSYYGTTVVFVSTLSFDRPLGAPARTNHK